MSHGQNDMLRQSRTFEVYNQGNVHFGGTNVTRDIAAQPYSYSTFLIRALNLLNPFFVRENKIKRSGLNQDLDNGGIRMIDLLLC